MKQLFSNEKNEGGWIIKYSREQGSIWLIPVVKQWWAVVSQGSICWLTWGPTTPGGPGGPVFPWNPCFDTKKMKSSEDWGRQIQTAGLCKTPAHVQSLLSVQGDRAVHLSLQVPADMQITPHKYSDAKRRRDTIRGAKRASANSQVDPSVRGNQLVPEGLADPEMYKSILSFTSGNLFPWKKQKAQRSGTYPLPGRSWWAIVSWVTLMEKKQD